HLFRNHIWEGIYQKCKEYFPDYISGNKMIPNYYYNSFNDDECIGNILEIEREEKIKLNFKIIWTDYDSKEIEVLENDNLNVILNITYNSFFIYGSIFNTYLK
ncbi:hypothetical protein H311_04952, partial [Anncaliia algerae PRA109]